MIKLKKFVVISVSSSGDRYTYFIEHYTEPTIPELIEWLKTNGNDIEGELDGFIQTVEEITEFKKLK